MKASGILFFTLFLLGAFSTWVLMVPSLLILPFPSRNAVRWRRKYISSVTGIFLDYAAFLIRWICNTKLFLYTSTPDELMSDGSIHRLGLLICNHRTRVDWMYAGWCYGCIMNFNSNLKMLLKESLKGIPVLGWAMQMMMYLFLTRRRDIDIHHIVRTLQYMIGSHANPIPFIFPEGTDLSKSNIAKSNSFARDHGMQELEYVLHPKSAGLAATLSCMRGRGLVCHDCTIAYKDFVSGVRTSEASLLQGHFPQEIHLIVNRHIIDEIPIDRLTLDKWLRGKFYEKERMLSEFYQHQYQQQNEERKECNESVSSPTSSPSSTPNHPYFPPPFEYPQPNFLRAVLFVGGSFAVIVGLLYLFIWFRWVVAFLAIACMGAKFGNGWDRIELALHYDMIYNDLNASEMSEQHEKSD